MNDARHNPEKVESTIRRIITYYIDSAHDKDAKDLILYLGGGMVPDGTVSILMPVLKSLVDKGVASKAFTSTSLKDLEQLRADVDAMYADRESTREALQTAINHPSWSDAEKKLALRFGLELLPADDITLGLLAHEVSLSHFTAGQIFTAFVNDSTHIVEFSGRWYADCKKRDYGEEWDSAEGNQQAGNPPPKVIGIAQGFMAKYLIFYLYAASRPDKLVDFLKLTKMPHGKKVAKDVFRIYRQTVKPAS